MIKTVAVLKGIEFIPYRLIACFAILKSCYTPSYHNNSFKTFTAVDIDHITDLCNSESRSISNFSRWMVRKVFQAMFGVRKQSPMPVSTPFYWSTRWIVLWCGAKALWKVQNTRRLVSPLQKIPRSLIGELYNRLLLPQGPQSKTPCQIYLYE